jgi:hypothetical protein
MAVAIIGLAIYAAVDPAHREWLAGLLRKDNPVNANADPVWDTPAGRELDAAVSHHFYVALPVSLCYPKLDLAHRSALPTIVQSSFLLGLMPNGSHSWDDVPADPKSMPFADAEKPFRLNNFQSSLLYLSDNIAQSRAQAATGVAENNAERNRYEWGIVIIGALTTIFISIKSMSTSQSSWYVAIGILAILFSAVGTSASSLNAFYAPSDGYIRNQKSLTQLRQLHADLGRYVASIGDDICKPMDANNAQDTKAKSVKEFSTRFIEITGAANSGPAQSAGTNPDTQAVGTSKTK